MSMSPGEAAPFVPPPPPTSSGKGQVRGWGPWHLCLPGLDLEACSVPLLLKHCLPPGEQHVKGDGGDQ